MFDKIKENEFNLNIPHFVETFEEEPEVDINNLKAKTDTLKKDYTEKQMKMKKYLGYLGA